MSDDVRAHYRLLKCVLEEDGIRVFTAQRITTGRVVMVHITTDPMHDVAALETQIRAQLAGLSPVAARQLIDIARLDAGVAVVTDVLTPPLTWRRWLSNVEMPVVSAPSPSESSSATPASPPASGPASGPASDPSSGPEPQPASATSFSAIFGTPRAPAPPALEEFPRPAASHVHVDLSDTPTPTAAPAPAAPPAAAPPAAQPAAQPVPAAAPGAFTQMFAPSAMASPSASPSAASAPAPASASPMPVIPVPPTPPAPREPGEFTRLFGAPNTAAPMPETIRPSPMHEAPPPAFSPLTPERQLESPPVEPRHRVVSSQPQYLAGIQQDGPSPIAPNVVSAVPALGQGPLASPMSPASLPPLQPLAPPPAPLPPHVSPLFTAAGPTAPTSTASPGGLSTPGILPPPIFSSGTATPLSALGGAAPLVNASAGPSEFTRLIASAPSPVVPPLAPTAERTPGRTGSSRRLPNGLIVVINAVLLIAALLMWFVLRRPIPTVQQVMPVRPVMPVMPSTPQLPTTPPR